MKNETKLPAAFAADAQTMNALVDAMGALVMCLAKHMPEAVRTEVASDLARLSAGATASGRPVVGRLMADLSRAAAP